MKRPEAPRLIFFERMGHMEGARLWEWEVVAYRRPLKGEYYLSGAIPQGWKAPNDLPTEYWVIRPGRAYRQQMTWVPVTEAGDAP